MKNKNQPLFARAALALLAFALLPFLPQCTPSPYYGHRSIHNLYVPKELRAENRNPYDPYKVKYVPADRTPAHHPLKDK